MKWIMWLVWTAASMCWINTGWVRISEGDYSFVPMVMLVLALFVILYFAEGLEIAIADLRDKDASQLANPATKKTLLEIQKDAEFFFSQRQIFVVSIISFVAISMDTKGFSAPRIGSIVNPLAIFLINFIFLNLSVLWFCQVAPKRLAVINSEQFLNRSRFIWPLIKFIGYFNIPGPSDDIVKVLKWIFGYKPRQLLPSRATQYNISAHLYGYCVDQYSTSIKIESDGSAEIIRTYATIFLHGRRSNSSGYIVAGIGPGTPISEAEVKIHAVAKLDPVEDLRDYNIALDRMFASLKIELAAGVEEVPLSDFPHSISQTRDPNNRVSWQIEMARQLPEGYWNDSAGKTPMILVIYSVRCSCGAGSFAPVGADHWEETIYNPSRKMVFSVMANDPKSFAAIRNVNVGLASMKTTLTQEEKRCLLAMSQALPIDFPIQSSVHKFSWDVLRLADGSHLDSWTT